MLTDEKAGRMFSMLHRGHAVAEIARRLKMGERTIREYRDGGILPSQQKRRVQKWKLQQDVEHEVTFPQSSHQCPQAAREWRRGVGAWAPEVVA